VANVVWVTADVHYAAAHRYDPNHAVFQDFSPFWESSPARSTPAPSAPTGSTQRLGAGGGTRTPNLLLQDRRGSSGSGWWNDKRNDITRRSTGLEQVPPDSLEAVAIRGSCHHVWMTDASSWLNRTSAWWGRS